MSHILNGRSKPGFDVLDKIGQAFPDINLNWLISGKGEMYVGRSNNSPLIQKSLFEDEKEERAKVITAVKAEPTEQPPRQFSVPEVAAAIMQTPPDKKLKRIVLFFSDGSFEDYIKDN